MSDLNVFLKKKTLYVIVLLTLTSVTIISVLTTLKKKLEKVHYFGRDAVLYNGMRRPIKWQIHSNYEHPNRKFKFVVFIEESIILNTK